MKTAVIGRLEVSVIGLGCNNFGRTLDQAGTNEVVAAALDSGITFFDTSDNYGDGLSESYLGTALGHRRADVVIATKFATPVPGVEGSGGASPTYIRRAVERSLRELGTDWIDLYQLHRPDPDTPIEDTLEEMNKLLDEGKVREIGCSNFDAGLLEDALDASRRLGMHRFVSNQVEYSLLERGLEDDGLSELSLGEHVAVLPFYPLACGMLTGKARQGEQPEGRLSMDRYQRFLTEENHGIVNGLRRFASDRELSMVQVALGWLLARAEVPSVTAGATKPSQVEANVTAQDWTPTAGDLAELDAITAGAPS